MTITFDGVELIDPQPFNKGYRVVIGTEELLSGKLAVQPSTETHLTIAFKCMTETYTDISGLFAKIGTKASLIIDGTPITNCYISSFSEKEWFPNKWEYSVAFLQETA